MSPIISSIGQSQEACKRRSPGSVHEMKIEIEEMIQFYEAYDC